MNHICIYWHPPISLLKHNSFQDSAPGHCIQRESKEGQGNLPCKNKKNVVFSNIPWPYKYEHCFVYTTIIDQLGGKRQFNTNKWFKEHAIYSIVLYNKLDCSSLLTCVFGESPSTTLTQYILSLNRYCKLSLHILQSTFNIICRIHFTHCGCQLQRIGIFCHRLQ